MGKNKVMMLVLIAAAAGLWIFIIMKIYNAYYSDEETAPVQVKTTMTEKLKMESDTFSIVANYRDPFLGETIRKPILSQKPMVPEKKKEVKPILPWPTVIYGGMIRNQKTNQQLALITVNGNNEVLSPGEIYQEVEVLKIYKDSVQLAFGNEKRF